ncbi:MAG: cytochrome c biogenesis protein CcsA [Planctomycetes bacterium]|nr:cytochrome c biogenesis protein CcsA [Planctomycetota bacterium]
MFDAGLAIHPWVGAMGALNGGALLAWLPGARKDAVGWRRAALVLLVLAFALNTTLLVARWVDAGRPPFKTLFETMIFYPWCVGLVTLVLVAMHRLLVLVPFAAGISAFGIGYALYRPDVDTVLLPPALQSGWFVPHVVTYFMSYAALFVSFALAILALAKRSRSFETYAHGAAIFGLCALSAGLVMGGVWGKFAWGDWWGWDPKENWALVTWLAYMLYAHLRLMEGWAGRRSMVVLVGAFCAVVFTYLGMNMLPTAEQSMHVYQ